MPSEKQLLQDCRRNKRKAQRILYDRYATAMFNVAVRICGDRDHANDVLQEAFLRVFQHLDQYNGEATLGAWIKRIVINCALNFLQKHRKDTLPLEADLIPADTTVKVAPTSYNVQRIHDAIKDLPPGARTVLTLFLIEGYQHQEIAEILDISVSTSKSQYHRARRLLREQLGSRQQLIRK